MGSSSKQRGVSAPERHESTLPVGEGNRILDKLLLLEQVIPPPTSCKSSKTPAASTRAAAR